MYGPGLFICNEGNFQYGNASMSYYDPSLNLEQNEIFIRANGYKLGDMAQSVSVYKGEAWIVANNSNVVWAIDASTFKEKGRIENFTSPRYIHFVNEDKAYVTQLWDNRIFIVNPKRYEIVGYIQVPGMEMESGSTEQMAQLGKYVYCTCWSYQNSVIKIDIDTDKVVEQLKIGIQPSGIVIDKNNKIWVLTDGGYEGNPIGYEAPELVKIDAETFEIEERFELCLGDMPSKLQLNGTRDILYWLNGDVWRMGVDDSILPNDPCIESEGRSYYGLSINPGNGEIYVADAIDYQQQGIIYRYSQEGALIDEFSVGVNPSSMAWK